MPDTKQIAFDAYHEIAALPILHTDAVCNIIEAAIKKSHDAEVERLNKELEKLAGTELRRQAIDAARQ